MAVIFVVLLSCLACGIAANPSYSSFLTPVGSRPSVPAVPVSASAVGRPTATSIPAVSGPAKGLGGRRQGVPAHGPVVFPPTAQRPTVTGVSSSVGAKGRRPSTYRPKGYAPAVGAASNQRPNVVGAPANGPAVYGQRPAPGAARKPNGSSHPNQYGRPQSGTYRSNALY